MIILIPNSRKIKANSLRRQEEMRRRGSYFDLCVCLGDTRRGTRDAREAENDKRRRKEIDESAAAAAAASAAEQAARRLSDRRFLSDGRSKRSFLFISYLN